jgi:CheY-like chemotaxis protein
VIPPLHALVVDDNDLVRRLLEIALEESGFVSIGAESGEVALESARALAPDVCIVDEIMPGMSGAELVRRLRSEPRLRHLAVVGISSRADSELALLQAGADVFLVKPVAEAALVSAVARALLLRRGDPVAAAAAP